MKALLNMYDSCSENVEVEVGDYVIANINDFGLKKGKKYKILGIDSVDLITVEVAGCARDYTIEYFDECLNNKIEKCYNCDGVLVEEYQVIIYDPELKIEKCCCVDCAEELKKRNQELLYARADMVKRQSIQILKKM